VMAEFKGVCQAAKFQTEWKRMDLLIQAKGRNTLVEFKFNLYRRTFDLQSKPLSWKGNAGAQNEREFWACVDKLKSYNDSLVQEKFLVLVYRVQCPMTHPSAKKYETIYANLSNNERIHHVEEITHCFDGLCCRLLSIK